MLTGETRLADLDQLVEEATANAVAERPDMLEVADRLTRWLYRLPHGGSSSAAEAADVVSPADVADEIISLLDASRPVALREALKGRGVHLRMTFRRSWWLARIHLATVT
jgi:hypothetical protein